MGQTERSGLIGCKSLNLGSSVTHLSVKLTQKSNDLTDFPIWNLMRRKYLCMTRAQLNSKIGYRWKHTFRDAG